MSSLRRRAALQPLLSLFLSGAASLSAQVFIQRYASTVAGGGDVLVACILSLSTLAGLGAGALLAGSRARGLRRPTRAWAMVEVICALAVAGFVPAFGELHRGVLSACGAIGGGRPVYFALLAVLQVGTAVPLAVLMGSNYPLAFEWFERRGGHEGRTAGLVLAANTLGAALGAVGAALALPLARLDELPLVSAAAYLLAGALALGLPGGAPAPQESNRRNPGENREKSGKSPWRLVFATGAAGFALETVAFRHFGVRHAGAPWTFALALGCHLSAWGLGCGLAGWGRLARLPANASLVALAGALGLAGWLLASAPREVALVLEPIAAWPFEVLWLPSWRTVAFFVPAISCGFAYAAIHREAAPDARGAARLYAANVAGCLAGWGLVAGILPAVGSSFALAPFVLAPLLALVLPLRTSAAAFAVILPFLLLCPEDVVAGYYSGIACSPVARDDVREDAASSAWLKRPSPRFQRRDLYVDGRIQTPDISNPWGGYRAFQVLFPASLAHRRRILNVGVALGVSNGNLCRLLPGSKIENVDCCPCLRWFWERHARENFGLLDAPNGRTTVTDGRLALAVGDGRWDVIQEFGSGEGMAGASVLKSVEFLRLARRRLSPQGVLIGHAASANYAAALQAVFARVYVLEGFPIFVGSDEPLECLTDLGDLGAAFTTAVEIARQEGLPRATHALRLTHPQRVRPVQDADPVSDYSEAMTPFRLEGDEPAVTLPF